MQQQEPWMQLQAIQEPVLIALDAINFWRSVIQQLDTWLLLHLQQANYCLLLLEGVLGTAITTGSYCHCDWSKGALQSNQTAASQTCRMEYQTGKRFNRLSSNTGSDMRAGGFCS